MLTGHSPYHKVRVLLAWEHWPANVKLEFNGRPIAESRTWRRPKVEVKHYSCPYMKDRGRRATKREKGGEKKKRKERTSRGGGLSKSGMTDGQSIALMKAQHSSLHFHFSSSVLAAHRRKECAAGLPAAHPTMNQRPRLHRPPALPPRPLTPLVSHPTPGLAHLGAGTRSIRKAQRSKQKIPSICVRAAESGRQRKSASFKANIIMQIM